MGFLAEPECIRIIKALDMARTLKLPVEWLPISSGAKIAMSSGTENPTGLHRSYGILSSLHKMASLLI